jgi:hypothetical protein
MSDEITREENRGQCEFCTQQDVVLVAALSDDPDQMVCAACHADERVPTAGTEPEQTSENTDYTADVRLP